MRLSWQLPLCHSSWFLVGILDSSNVKLLKIRHPMPFYGMNKSEVTDPLTPCIVENARSLSKVRMKKQHLYACQ